MEKNKKIKKVKTSEGNGCLIIPKTNEEIFKQVEKIGVIDEFCRKKMGMGTYFIYLNGIDNECRNNAISIYEIQQEVEEELLEIYKKLSENEMNEDTEINKIVKYLLENRFEDLVEMETNYCINVICNRVDEELKELGNIEEILIKNKNTILETIENDEVKKIVEVEFYDIIKYVVAQILINSIKIAKIDKIYQRGNFQKVYGKTYNLYGGDYKVSMSVLQNKEKMKLENIDSCSKDYNKTYYVRRYSVIRYLLDKITPQYIKVDIDFDYLLEDYLGETQMNLEILAERIKNKKNINLNGIKLDIFS